METPSMSWYLHHKTRWLDTFCIAGSYPDSDLIPEKQTMNSQSYHLGLVYNLRICALIAVRAWGNFLALLNIYDVLHWSHIHLKRSYKINVYMIVHYLGNFFPILSYCKQRRFMSPYPSGHLPKSIRNDPWIAARLPWCRSKVTKRM